VIAAACRSPADFELQRDIWDHATLPGALMSAGLMRSISERSVGRILQAAEIKPHQADAHQFHWMYDGLPLVR
jgi:hypothetical protein